VQVAIEKLVRQLYKLVYVESVTDLTQQPYVSSDLLLVKVCGA
jgi:acetolactate synthase small subunit